MRPIHRAFSRALITAATIGAATSIALIVRRRAGMGPRARRRRRRRTRKHRRADVPGARRIRNRRSDNTAQRRAAQRGVGQGRGDARLDGPPRPQRRRRHRELGDLDRRAVGRDIARPVRAVPDLGDAAQPAVGQPARDADVLRRAGGPLGSAAATRRRRARAPGADARRCPGPRHPSTPWPRPRAPEATAAPTAQPVAAAPAAVRRHGPLAGRRRADRGRGGRRAGRRSGGAARDPQGRGHGVRRSRWLAVLALAGAGTASAHAIRISTDPAQDAALSQGPGRVSATFNEKLQTSFAAMTLVGPDGNLWSTGPAKVDGRRRQRRAAAARPGGHLHGELPGDLGGRPRRVGVVVVSADAGRDRHTGAARGGARSR